MTAASVHIIEDFEALPDPEKREVLARLLQIASRLDYGPLTDEELVASADRVFVGYDGEEQSE